MYPKQGQGYLNVAIKKRYCLRGKGVSLDEVSHLTGIKQKQQHPIEDIKRRDTWSWILWRNIAAILLPRGLMPSIYPGVYWSQTKWLMSCLWCCFCRTSPAKNGYGCRAVEAHIPGTGLVDLSLAPEPPPSRQVHKDTLSLSLSVVSSSQQISFLLPCFCWWFFCILSNTCINQTYCCDRHCNQSSPVKGRGLSKLQTEKEGEKRP